MSKRILVADDHGVVRDGLREMIRQQHDLAVVAEAATGPEALHLAREHALDLVMLDISLPQLGGIQVLQQLRTEGFAVPVLFFSMHPADQYASFVRHAGAQGFITKDAGAAEVVAAMRKVLGGGSYFPSLRKAPRRALVANPFDRLSQREREVMQGLIRGQSQTEIAAELGVTNKSIGTYRLRILTKLGVENNAELVALATRLGNTT